MRALVITIGAWAGLLWLAGALLVLAVTVLDLVRCRQLPTPIDVGLVVLGPLSLALALSLGLKDAPRDR